MTRSTMLLVLLTMMFAVVLAGCDNNNAASLVPSNTDAPVQITVPNEANKEVKFPLAESITLDIFAQSNPTAGSYTEMSVLNQLKEKTNVEVKWTTVTEAGGLIEKKNLLFASNDLPDAFYGHALTEDDIIKYGSQGMLIPLEDLIEKYAPNIQKLFEQYPNLRNELTAKDGHIYSLPQINDNGFTEALQTLFINKKWLDKLELMVPETTEQFVEVLKAFRDNDMNGNGKDDEIPLSFVYTNQGNGENGLIGSFGIVGRNDKDFLYLDGKNVEFVPAQPEFKDFLTYMHEMHEQKLVDPEVFTHSVQVYQAKIKSAEPIFGAFIGWTNALYFGESDSEYVAIPPMKGPQGHQLWVKGAPQINKTGFSITSVNKNPEITMAWVDLQYDEKTSLELAYGGPMGVNVEANSDGTYNLITPPAGMSGIEFKYSNAPGANSAFAITRNVFNRIHVTTKNEVEKKEYIKMYRPYVPDEIYPSIYLSAEDLTTLERIKTDIITGYMKVTVPKFMINGFSDVEWDAYIAQMKKMGLDEMTAIYQRNYDEFLSKKQH